MWTFREISDTAKQALEITSVWIADHTRFSFLFKGICLIPLVMYLVVFQSQSKIPFDSRLDIDSDTLPYLENLILFGNSLQHWPRDAVPEDWDFLVDIMDIFAGSLYLIHFFGAWFFAIALYIFHRKRTSEGLPIPQPWNFLFCLGLLNLTAVIAQLSWPTAPPWYVEKYGDQDPSYTMGGDEAGLANVDRLLGIGLFDNLYGTSPLVFASFPSLHGGWPIIIALSMPNKWSKAIGFVYAACVWWAAMYLGHHFLVDLLGSLVFSLTCYFIGTAVIRLILKSESRFWASKREKGKWQSLQTEMDDKVLSVQILVEEEQQIEEQQLEAV